MKGNTFRKIQNTGRWNYSALGSRQVSIYWLGSYNLILLPSCLLAVLCTIQIHVLFMHFESVRGYGFFNNRTSFKNAVLFTDDNSLSKKDKRIDHSLKG